MARAKPSTVLPPAPEIHHRHDPDHYHKFDPTPIVVNVVLLLLFAVAYFVTKFCCFRKVLQDDIDGPTDVHIQTNKAIEGQEKEFIKNGGIPGSKTSKVQHDKNMAKIKKIIGAKEAAKLEKELEARGMELDPDAIDKAVKEGGPELAKTMFRERCGPTEALRIIMKKQAAAALKEDPDLQNKLKENPEMAKQAAELGVITKSQLQEIEAAMAANPQAAAAAAAAAAGVAGSTPPGEVPPTAPGVPGEAATPNTADGANNTKSVDNNEQKTDSKKAVPP